MGYIVKERQNLSLCVIALFMGFTACIYAPFEIYLLNKNELWFHLSLFWWIPIIVGSIAIIMAILFGLILKNSVNVLYRAFLFAVALGVYLQGNFLNLKIGVLNGSAIQWSEYRTHIIVNMLIWIAILVMVIYFALQKTKLFNTVSIYSSFFLVAIQVVSLIVLMVPVIASGGANEKQQCFVSDEGINEIGDKNVVVFILDMFDNEYMKDILADEPSLEESLDGFTYFQNFSGSYSTTVYSIAHLTTGKNFYNEEPIGQWVQDTTKEDSYLDNLAADGFETYLYTDFYYYFPDRIAKNAVNYSNASLKIKGYRPFTVNLYQLVACKYFPDFLKAYIWMDGTEFDDWKTTDNGYLPYNGSNSVFISKMQQDGLNVEKGTKQFKFIHLNGAHYPYENDEKGQEVAKNTVSAVQCARGALQTVLDYIDELKQNGAYDNTAIIITADHGYYWDGTLTSPTFLVKPMNATGDFQISDSPAGQTDFAATILELSGLNQEHKYGKSVFEIPLESDRERFFYQYYLSESGDDSRYRLIEYQVDNKGNTRDHFHLTDVEYTDKGQKIQHSIYCKTCKGTDTENDNNSNPLAIVHHKDTNYPNN